MTTGLNSVFRGHPEHYPLKKLALGSPRIGLLISLTFFRCSGYDLEPSFLNVLFSPGRQGIICGGCGAIQHANVKMF
jgi:hypothetical protein